MTENAYGLKPGDHVWVVTTVEDGKSRRDLFLFEAAALNEMSFRRNEQKTLSVEPWNGREPVDFDNGD